MNLLQDIQSNASSEYSSFLEAHTASISVGDDVILYGTSDLPERNTTYEVETYLPGWFTIGDDSGGQALLMRLNGSSTVYLCGHGSIGSFPPEVVSESFSTWFEASCPGPWMDDDEDFDD